MKIQSINNNFYSNRFYQKNIIQNPTDSVSNQEPAFKHTGMWNQFELDILNKSEAEIMELGKYFHLSSEEELRAVSKIRNIFGFVKEEKSAKAYEILSKAVKAVKEQKTVYENTIKMLQNKFFPLSKEQKRNLEFYTKQIQELDKKFNSREEKFYVKDNSLSEEDIAYFRRYDNDY